MMMTIFDYYYDLDVTVIAKSWHKYDIRRKIVHNVTNR